MIVPPSRRLETLHMRPDSSNSYNAPYAPKNQHTISLPLVPKGEKKKDKRKEAISPRIISRLSPLSIPQK